MKKCYLVFRMVRNGDEDNRRWRAADGGLISRCIKADYVWVFSSLCKEGGKGDKEKGMCIGFFKCGASDDIRKIGIMKTVLNSQNSISVCNVSDFIKLSFILSVFLRRVHSVIEFQCYIIGIDFRSYLKES